MKTSGWAMFRDNASPLRKASRIASCPNELAAARTPSRIDIHGHRIGSNLPAQGQRASHTIIITGFSINVLKAPISSAPSAPSIAR